MLLSIDPDTKHNLLQFESWALTDVESLQYDRPDLD